MVRLIWIGCVVMAMQTVGLAQNFTAATLVVTDEVVNTIDTRLFGQFLERASFGEPGPEAFVDKQTGRLPDNVMAMLKEMAIPVVRFPGGTDIDYIDWRDMIDNVPGRAGPRPITTGHSGRTITNHFGYDEYFAVRDAMKWETILVVNLLDGLAKKRPLDEAAMLAAGLVAYANAPQGAKLPEGMPDWPSVRAKNGHAAPFGTQYIQIGNEMWLGKARNAAREATGLEGEALGQWYRDVYVAYIKAIRQVDAAIPIIIDQWSAPGHWQVVLNDPYIRANVKYVAHHKYAPGNATQITREGEEVATDQWTDEQWWWAWATLPGVYDDEGQNIAFGAELDSAAALGYQIAATEWNWNGWRWQQSGAGFDAPAAAGIGTAGWLHGMMRQGGKIRMANQSMLLGVGWQIGAIHADPEDITEPHFNPQGTATTFYRKHHGDRVLRAALAGVESRPQPYRVGWGPPLDRVALLDVLVTASDTHVYIHAINRAFENDLPLEVDLSALGALGDQAVQHLFTCKLKADQGHGGSKGMAEVTRRDIGFQPKTTVNLPPRSASIIVVQRKR